MGMSSVNPKNLEIFFRAFYQAFSNGRVSTVALMQRSMQPNGRICIRHRHPSSSPPCLIAGVRPSHAHRTPRPHRRPFRRLCVLHLHRRSRRRRFRRLRRRRAYTAGMFPPSSPCATAGMFAPQARIHRRLRARRNRRRHADGAGDARGRSCVVLQRIRDRRLMLSVTQFPAACASWLPMRFRHRARTDRYMPLSFIQ